MSEHSQTFMQFRPQGELPWCTERAEMDILISEADGCQNYECECLEVRFVKMTEEEFEALPEFSGW